MHKLYQNRTTLQQLPVSHYSTKIHLNCQLPKISKGPATTHHTPAFTKKDVHKLLQHIFKKGSRFTQLKKETSEQDQPRIEERLMNSSYVQFAVRKELQLMGDERRIGTGLRGLNKLLLEEFQAKIWSMVEVEVELFYSGKEEAAQRQNLYQILQL